MTSADPEGSDMAGRIDELIYSWSDDVRVEVETGTGESFSFGSPRR